MQTILERETSVWWTDRLTPPPPESGPPLFRTRSKVYSAKRALVEIPVPAGLRRRLEDMAPAELPGLLIAGVAGVLHRYTGNERIAVGSAVSPTEEPNAVVVLVDVPDEIPFATLARAASQSAREAYEHADDPLAEVVRRLGMAEVQNRHPLFAVAVRVAASQGPLPADLRHDITVELRAGGALSLEYNARLHEQETVERFGRHVLNLLASGLEQGERPLHAIEYLDADELHRLLEEWSRGPVEAVDDRPVHRLFEEQAARTPDWEAIRHEGGVYTYAELNRRANQLAHYLRAQGAGVGKHVGLCVSAGADLLLALLGILKSGAAVVPLVPTFPAARNNMAIEDADLHWVVTERKLRPLLPENRTRPVSLDELATEIGAQPGDDPQSGVSGGDLVYVLFTSGSTGRPKGVCMEHRSLANLVQWQRQRGGDPGGRRTMQRTSIGFDVSFQEIFSTWCFGGCLAVVTDAGRDDVSQLPVFIDQHAIERVFLPPVALHQLAASAATGNHSLASLREIIVAGEALQISMPVIRLFREIECTLDNQYGPTETHVATAHLLSGLSTRWPPLPPIGRPVRNARVYILDSWLRPVPAGVPGEICIGGVPVARGYIKRDELNEKSFLRDPFSEDGKGRLYRTGDVGRFLADGTIEFLGRRDHQVKIRGYRIELGEIEAVLRQAPGVRQAAVTVHEDPVRGKQLAAYVVTATPGQPSAAVLRSFLLERLPGHMVPSPAGFVHLDAMPLTPTGKIDRRALPAPAVRPGEEDAVEGISRSDTERQIASIWAKVLGFETVGLNDNFLDLGGHSLLGIQIVSQINEIYNVRLPLAMFLRGTTVSQTAAYLEEVTGARTAASAPAAPAPRTGLQPQTFELPNGRRITGLHRSEAAYLYVDVFEHRTYDRCGIEYPEEGVVFDVGANIGLFTLYAKEKSPKLRVFAFEPAPPLFDVLRRNAGELPNVELFDFGLADREGTAELTYYPALSGMSSLYPDPAQERALLGTILRNLADQGRDGMSEVLPFAGELVEDRLESARFACRFRPLSKVIAESGIERIDLLKIDVQKAEMDVLKGIADADWPKIRQVVVEVHDLDHQVDRISSLLRDRGYNVQVEQDPLHKGTVVHFVYAT